jgi:hypothetical protein
VPLFEHFLFLGQAARFYHARQGLSTKPSIPSKLSFLLDVNRYARLRFMYPLTGFTVQSGVTKNGAPGKQRAMPPAYTRSDIPVSSGRARRLTGGEEAL